MKLFVAALASFILIAGGVPASSQSAYTAFGLKPSRDLTVPALADTEVTALLQTLDKLLAAPPAGTAWREHANGVLWQFGRRVQAGRLTKAQETRVLAHLDRIGATRADAAGAVAPVKRVVSTLAVGKVAPDIVGTDLDGKPLRLSEFRNKVVVLTFSAEWCAICRAQAPYEQFLMDRYAEWPLVLLGVQAASNRDAARRDHQANPVAHRVWWDQARGETGGPIATAWNVRGWPASYVLDGDGVIQFIDLREEDLLKAVRQLVDAQADRDATLLRRSRPGR